MNLSDTLQFASTSLNSSRSRSLLMIIAMSIGVAAVVILTALGEGARLYVINQFSSLGTNLGDRASRALGNRRHQPRHADRTNAA